MCLEACRPFPLLFLHHSGASGSCFYCGKKGGEAFLRSVPPPSSAFLLELHVFQGENVNNRSSPFLSAAVS